MHISNRIRKLRISLQLERKDIAKGILSYSHYSNIETGRYVPQEDILKLLAERLDVPHEYLINYEKHEEDLENLLMVFYSYIEDFNNEKARFIYEDIKKRYPVIYLPKQETNFKLLEAFYLVRVNQIEEGLKVYQDEIVPMLYNVDIHAIPLNYKNAYLYIQGVYYINNREYHKSYQAFNELMSSTVSTNLLASTNYNMALVCSNTYEWEQAVHYASEALLLHFKKHNWIQVAQTEVLLGALYLDNDRELDLAEEHFHKALSLINDNKLTKLKTIVLHNLGIIYHKKNMLDKALDYLYLSLNEKKELGEGLIITYKEISEIYIEQKRVEELEIILEESKTFIENEIDRYKVEEVMAKLAYLKKDFKEYEMQMQKLINYYSENKRWKVLGPIAEELADYYYAAHKYKPSSEYYCIALTAFKNI